MSAVRPVPGPSLLLQARSIGLGSSRRSSLRGGVRDGPNPFDELNEVEFDSFVDDVTVRLKNALAGKPLVPQESTPGPENEDVFGKVVSARQAEQTTASQLTDDEGARTSSSPPHRQNERGPLFAPRSETSVSVLDEERLTSREPESDQEDELIQFDQLSEEGVESDQVDVEDDEGDSEFVEEQDDEQAAQLAHAPPGLNTPSDDERYSDQEADEREEDYASRLQRFEHDLDQQGPAQEQPTLARQVESTPLEDQLLDTDEVDIEPDEEVEEDELASSPREPDANYLPSPASLSPQSLDRSGHIPQPSSSLRRAVKTSGSDADESQDSDQGEQQEDSLVGQIEDDEEEWFGQDAVSESANSAVEEQESETTSLDGRIPYHLKGKEKAEGPSDDNEEEESDSGTSISSLSINQLFEQDLDRLQTLRRDLTRAHDRYEAEDNEPAVSFFQRQIEKVSQAIALNESSDHDAPSNPSQLGEADRDEEQEENDDDDDNDSVVAALHFDDDGMITVDMDLVKTWPVGMVAVLVARLELAIESFRVDDDLGERTLEQLVIARDEAKAYLEEIASTESDEQDEQEGFEHPAQSEDENVDALYDLAEELVRRRERGDDEPVEVSADRFPERSGSATNASSRTGDGQADIILSSDDEDDELAHQEQEIQSHDGRQEERTDDSHRYERTPSPPQVHDVLAAGEWNPSTPIVFGQGSTKRDLGNQALPENATSELEATAQAVLNQLQSAESFAANPSQAGDKQDFLDPTLGEDVQTSEKAGEESQNLHVSIAPEPEVVVIPGEPAQDRHVSIEVDELSDSHALSDSERALLAEVLSSRASSLGHEDRPHVEIVDEPANDDETTAAFSTSEATVQASTRKSPDHAHASQEPEPAGAAVVHAPSEEAPRVPGYGQPEEPVADVLITDDVLSQGHGIPQIQSSPSRRSVTIDIEEHAPSEIDDGESETPARQADDIVHLEAESDDDRNSQRSISSENAEADLIDVHELNPDPEFEVPDLDQELPSEDELPQVPHKIATPPADPMDLSSPQSSPGKRRSPQRNAASLPPVREESPDPLDSLEVADPALIRRVRSTEEDLIVDKQLPNQGADYERSPEKESPLLIVDDDDDDVAPSDLTSKVPAAELTPLPPPVQQSAALDTNIVERASLAEPAASQTQETKVGAEMSAPNEADDEMSEHDAEAIVIPSSSLPVIEHSTVLDGQLEEASAEPVLETTVAEPVKIPDSTQDPGLAGDEESNGEETEQGDPAESSREPTPIGLFANAKGERAKSESPVFDEPVDEVPGESDVATTKVPLVKHQSLDDEIRSRVASENPHDSSASPTKPITADEAEQELLATLQPVPRESSSGLGEDRGEMVANEEETVQVRDEDQSGDEEVLSQAPASPRRSARLRSRTPAVGEGIPQKAQQTPDEAESEDTTDEALVKQLQSGRSVRIDDNIELVEDSADEAVGDATKASEEVPETPTRRLSRRVLGKELSQASDTDSPSTRRRSKRARSSETADEKQSTPRSKRAKSASARSESEAAQSQSEPRRHTHHHQHSHGSRGRRKSTPLPADAPVTRSHCEMIRLQLTSKLNTDSTPYVFVVPSCALASEDAQETMNDFDVQNLGPVGAIEEMEATHVGGDGLGSIMIGDDTVEAGIQDEDVAHAIRRIVGNDLWHEGSVELLPRDSTSAVVEPDEPEEVRRSSRKRRRTSKFDETPSKSSKKR